MRHAPRIARSAAAAALLLLCGGAGIALTGCNTKKEEPPATPPALPPVPPPQPGVGGPVPEQYRNANQPGQKAPGAR
jgi:hypothetical protein